MKNAFKAPVIFALWCSLILLPMPARAADLTLSAAQDAWFVTPSSANLAAVITNETGSGALVFATSPTLVTPALGTPSAIDLANATGTILGNLVNTANPWADNEVADSITVTGSVGGGTVDATGFDGNLTMGDNTVQEIAQKLDDLSIGGGFDAT